MPVEKRGLWVIAILLLAESSVVYAEPLAPSPRPSTSTRKKVREQKETEGTEAPGRFEANTILKSEYQLNGQPLEVDPD